MGGTPVLPIHPKKDSVCGMLLNYALISQRLKKINSKRQKNKRGTYHESA